MMRKTFVSLFSIIMMAVMLVIGLFSASLFTKKAMPLFSPSSGSSQEFSIHSFATVQDSLIHTRRLPDSKIKLESAIERISKRETQSVSSSSFMELVTADKPAPVEEFAKLETELQNIIMVETNENYVTDVYSSIDDVRHRLLQIMSPELAEGCIDVYFREAAEGGVILVPTEAPLWFDFQADFDIEYINDVQVTIRQEHQSELFGHVRLSITYENIEHRWLMTNRYVELLT